MKRKLSFYVYVFCFVFFLIIIAGEKSFLLKKSVFYREPHAELCGYWRNLMPLSNGRPRSLLVFHFIYPSQVNLEAMLDLDQTAHQTLIHSCSTALLVPDSNWGGGWWSFLSLQTKIFVLLKVRY